MDQPSQKSKLDHRLKINHCEQLKTVSTTVFFPVLYWNSRRTNVKGSTILNSLMVHYTHSGPECFIHVVVNWNKFLMLSCNPKAAADVILEIFVAANHPP